MEALSQLQSNLANKNLGNNNCISPLNVIALVCRQKRKKNQQQDTPRMWKITFKRKLFTKWHYGITIALSALIFDWVFFYFAAAAVFHFVIRNQIKFLLGNSDIIFFFIIKQKKKKIQKTLSIFIKIKLNEILFY